MPLPTSAWQPLNARSHSYSGGQPCPQYPGVTTPSPQSSQVALVLKDVPANAGGARDAGSISGSGRSAGGGHSSPSQGSCLENPMERGAQRAIVHRAAESDMTEATWKACTGMEETAMKIVGENPDLRNLEVICTHISP